ncbi:protein FAR1-RELATED SEQUENCE 5-like, partial [Camellia sinensis]|uniref:protein FAR1-RELATED SEQUENCE 5-like n=1 Tax=Camellia sinensis TaxID=4442 RepID=UPI001036D4A5
LHELHASIDIDSNNPSLNGSEKVEETENNPSLNEIGEVEEPKKGMCFSSKQEVYSFYAKYAKHLGFTVTYRTQIIGQDGKVKYFGIECTRARKRTKRSEVHPLEPSLSSFIECKAQVRATLQKDERFKLTTVVLEHTHDLIPSDSRHFAMNKRILTPVKRRLEINDEVGIGVARNFHSIVVEGGGYEALTFDERDARNYIQRVNHHGQSILLGCELLSNENTETFVWLFREWLSCMSDVPPKAIITDQCRAMQNAIEVAFPQARHRVNHHGQSILLGCELLSNENTETFVWLFREWLSCMSDVPLKAIITDQCRAMQNAIEVVFPQARHLYDCFTKDEFDEEWQAIIAKFKLDDNEWLGHYTVSNIGGFLLM